MCVCVCLCQNSDIIPHFSRSLSLTFSLSLSHLRVQNFTRSRGDLPCEFQREIILSTEIRTTIPIIIIISQSSSSLALIISALKRYFFFFRKTKPAAAPGLRTALLSVCCIFCCFLYFFSRSLSTCRRLTAS